MAELGLPRATYAAIDRLAVLATVGVSTIDARLSSSAPYQDQAG